MTRQAAALLGTGLAFVLASPASEAQEKAETRPDQEARPTGAAQGAEADRIIADWPATPKMVASQMIARYGPPDEATRTRLIWHDNGPWKRTIVHREEVPHNFPKPHTDVLEQVINYEVPADKLDELAAFDGSVVADRTRGELAAHCDMEAANFLALNLANDIATGKKSVEEARRAYSRDMVALLTGSTPPSMARLQFQPPRRDVGDPGRTTIAGAPRRVTEPEIQRVRGGERVSEGEALGVLFALNAHEVQAANTALENAQAPAVKQFARQLRNEHGAGVQRTLQVARTTDVTPIHGPMVESLQEDVRGDMARLVRLDGREFDRAYVNQMIEEHRMALSLIDDRLLPAAETDEVRQLLTGMRGHIAEHLEQARRLQQNLGGQ